MFEPNSQQDFPLSEVPQDQRHGVMSLTWVLFGFTFFTATMMAGGQVGHAYGLTTKLWLAVVCGNGLLAFYACSLALVAFRSGLTTALMSRFAFGDKGCRFADLLLGLTQVGWYAWGTDTVVRVLLEMTGLDPVLRIPLILLAGALFCSSAVIGYRGLEILAATTVPLMAGLIFWSGWLAWGEAFTRASPGTGGLGFASAVTLIVGTFVSGATQSTNWTRYASSARAAVGVTGAAFFLGNGLMVAFGALGAAVYQTPDVVEVLLRQGFFLSALFMLLANIWTTQDNTIYNVSVVGCHLLRTENRRAVTVAGAALGTLLALLGFADLLVPFLLLLGTAIPPIGGVILADFFWGRKGRYPGLGGANALPDFRWESLVAYGVGVVAAATLPGIAPVTGIVSSFLCQVFLAKRG